MPTPNAHHFKTPRTAHYYTLGEAGPHTKRMWLVCHGYGQLAENFIRRFDVVAGPEDYVVAPEGLSRFYWGGLNGPVAASWMTRGNRLDEIEDFTTMLSTLYQSQMAKLPDDVEVILFGFSQGCATQIRWMMKAFPRFNQLWLWGGMIPEDLNYTTPEVQSYLADKPIYHFLGDQDELIKPAYIELHRQLIKTQSLNVQEFTYSGDHRVIRTELSKFWTMQKEGGMSA